MVNQEAVADIDDMGIVFFFSQQTMSESKDKKQDQYKELLDKLLKNEPAIIAVTNEDDFNDFVKFFKELNRKLNKEILDDEEQRKKRQNSLKLIFTGKLEKKLEETPFHINNELLQIDVIVDKDDYPSQSLEDVIRTKVRRDQFYQKNFTFAVGFEILSNSDVDDEQKKQAIARIKEIPGGEALFKESGAKGVEKGVEKGAGDVKRFNEFAQFLGGQSDLSSDKEKLLKSLWYNFSLRQRGPIDEKQVSFYLRGGHDELLASVLKQEIDDTSFYALKKKDETRENENYAGLHMNVSIAEEGGKLSLTVEKVGEFGLAQLVEFQKGDILEFTAPEGKFDEFAKYRIITELRKGNLQNCQIIRGGSILQTAKMQEEIDKTYEIADKEHDDKEPDDKEPSPSHLAIAIIRGRKEGSLQQFRKILDEYNGGQGKKRAVLPPPGDVKSVGVGLPSPAPRSDAGQHKKQETTNSDLKAIDPEEIGLDLDLDPGDLESVIPIESRVDEQPPPPPIGRLPLQPTPPIGSPKKLPALEVPALKVPALKVPPAPRSYDDQDQEQETTTPSTASVDTEQPQPPATPPDPQRQVKLPSKKLTTPGTDEVNESSSSNTGDNQGEKLPYHPPLRPQQPQPPARLPLQPTPPIGSPKKLSALDEVPSSPRSDAGQHQEQETTTPSTASVDTEQPQPPVVPGYWGLVRPPSRLDTRPDDGVVGSEKSQPPAVASVGRPASAEVRKRAASAEGRQRPESTVQFPSVGSSRDSSPRSNPFNLK